MKPACVLQVEDDENDIFLLQYAFSSAKLPHTLKAVRRAKEAIEYLSGSGAFADRAQHPLPSLVLLDLQLPGGSGFEVLQWMRQQPDFRELPVVIFTSSSRPEDMQTAYRLGANSYLVKPPGIDKLVALVKLLAEFWLVHNRAAQPALAA